MDQQQRLLSLVQGILAANIFDWGAKACVELYTNGTILDIYREARRRLSKRPWRVDDFDDFLARVYGSSSSNSNSQQPQLLGTAADAPAVAPASAGSQQGAQHVQQHMQQLQLQEAAEQETEQQQHAADDPATELVANTTESPFCNASAVAAAGSGLAAAGGSAAPPPGAQPADNSSCSATSQQQQQQQQQADVQLTQAPFRRVMVFVDNAGADIVLGMLPFVREMLRLGCEVVMVANSLPAINDITAAELRSLLSAAAEVCPIIKAARAAALAHEAAPGACRASSSLVGGPSIPPYPGLRQRQSSAQDLLALAAGNAAAGKGAGAAGAGSAAATPVAAGCGSLSQGAFGSPLASCDGSVAARECPGKSAASPSAAAAGGAGAEGGRRSELQQALSNSSSNSSSFDGSPSERSSAAAAGEAVEPRLFVLGNGSGSPCLDLSRVPAALADATVGVDLLAPGDSRHGAPPPPACATMLHLLQLCSCMLTLVRTRVVVNSPAWLLLILPQVIEGMGRAIHTNLRTPFKCDTLKLAMIKTERLAVKLFSGSLYDCMCSFQRAPPAVAGAAAAAGHAADALPPGTAHGRAEVGPSTEQ
ncbi:hypothetical protein COO60DRAFT_1234607 [Scenedesmus sp. NREL 46B-D3]|nr:hypothetical protein COO60DRAFT_1234607 [Scenedesmus sp. NREL 46B-D3]